MTTNIDHKFTRALNFYTSAGPNGWDILQVCTGVSQSNKYSVICDTCQFYLSLIAAFYNFEICQKYMSYGSHIIQMKSKPLQGEGTNRRTHGRTPPLIEKTSLGARSVKRENLLKNSVYSQSNVCNIQCCFLP